MKILDINGMVREIKSITTIDHERTSAIVGDDNEEVIDIVKYVQVTVVGKTGREWIDWYPLDEFKKMNPDIEVE